MNKFLECYKNIPKCLLVFEKKYRFKIYVKTQVMGTDFPIDKFHAVHL